MHLTVHVHVCLVVCVCHVSLRNGVQGLRDDFDTSFRDMCVSFRRLISSRARS